MDPERNDLLNLISRNTIEFRIKSWIDNFIANQPRIHDGYGIASMIGTLRGVPAIIVGSGPTLDRNIRFLDALQNKACIIACDSVVKALLKNNVRPHLVLVTDSKPRVKDFFAGVDTSKLNFVVDSFVHPEVVDFLEGKKYWYSTLPVENCPFTKALNQWTGFIGNLGTGGCVATSIWCFVVDVLGCEPDILVGLPEAFYDPAEMYAKAVTSTIETEPYTTAPIKTTDIFGEPCYTYPALQSFAYWFQDVFLRVPGIHINCSEGGILKENILNMPLVECARRYLTREYDIEGMLFYKETLADVVIASVDDDISQFRAFITILLDGPGVPNLALRAGITPQEVMDRVNVLRGLGLNISEGRNRIALPDGSVEEQITVQLEPPSQELIDAYKNSRGDMRPAGQQGAPGQEYSSGEEPADPVLQRTGGEGEQAPDEVFTLNR